MIMVLRAALWAAFGSALPGAILAQSLFRSEIATDGLAQLEQTAFHRAAPLVGPRQSPLRGGGSSIMGNKAMALSQPGSPLARVPPVPRGARAVLAPTPRPDPGAEAQRCLTEAIYFEARGESERGQQAVAEVVLNRVDSPRHPDSVCDVVNEGTGRLHACQFSYTCDGKPETVTEPRAWARAEQIAERMLRGGARSLTRDATHYHATYVSPHWARVYPQTAQVGTHVFYRQIPGR